MPGAGLPKYDTNTETLRNTPLSDPRFVHLRLHTDYSLVDGVVRVKELIKTCASQSIPAVAVTDDSNLFAMIKFYSAAMNAGVKPLMGADLWVESVHIEAVFPGTERAGLSEPHLADQPCLADQPGSGQSAGENRVAGRVT